MTRLKQAWLALRGKLEPQSVAGPPVNVERVTLYRVDAEVWGIRRMYSDGVEGVYQSHHTSCEAAFAAIQGKDYFHVEQVAAVRVGTRHFLAASEVKVRPKPKKAKGAAA